MTSAIIWASWRICAERKICRQVSATHLSSVRKQRTTCLAIITSKVSREGASQEKYKCGSDALIEES